MIMSDVGPATESSRRDEVPTAGPETASRARAAFAVPLLAGGASALLYLFVVFSFAFLVPVQVVFSRAGRKAGIGAAGVSALIIAGALWGLLHGSGASDRALAAIALIPPLAFLAGLALLNARFWDGRPALYRVLAATAALSLAAAPAIVLLASDASLHAYIAKSLDAVFVAPLKAQAGQGYDASALVAAFDPRILASAFVQTIVSSYAAIVFAMLGGSWWLGGRAASAGTGARSRTKPLSEFKMPYLFIWPFLGAWALVLAAALLQAPQAPRAIVLNCALVLSIAYAAQGLGIAGHFADRFGIPKSIRVAFAVTAVAALATPTLSLVVAIALPVLGVTEVWIPYRTFKGAGA